MSIETLDDLQKRLAALGPDLTDAQSKEIACVLIGHSRIVHHCFGYYTCARCGTQVGDALGGSYSAKHNVIVHHDCTACRENFQKCTWRDTYRAPDPFEPRNKT